MKKLFIAVFCLLSFAASAATVHLGQVNRSWDLRSGAFVNHASIGATLSSTAASIGSSANIEIDGTSHVGAYQSNAVYYQSADAGIHGVRVGEDLDQTAASIGNSLQISIDECGKCGTGSNVHVMQTNYVGHNSAWASIDLASVGGSMTQVSAAIGNSASINITN